MFQVIGDLLYYLIISSIGIALLLMYVKQQKPYQLWSGIGLFLIGALLGTISFFKNQDFHNNTITPNDSTAHSQIDTIKAFSEYRDVIISLLKESDTIKTDTIIPFYDFKINLREGFIYENTSEEPMIIFPDSAVYLLINFKEEPKKLNESLSEYSESIVDNLINNPFSSGNNIKNKQVLVANKVIQYDYSKTRSGVEILSGQLFFVIKNNKTYRISICKLGLARDAFEKNINDLKEELKNNLLKQCM